MKKSKNLILRVIPAISVVAIALAFIHLMQKPTLSTEVCSSDTVSSVAEESIEPEIVEDTIPSQLKLLWQKSYSSNSDLKMSIANIGNTYPVKSIVVNMENMSDSEILFGEDWRIDYLEGEFWKPLPYGPKILKQMKEENLAVVLSLVAIIVEPHTSRKHRHNAYYYSETIVPGIYRIAKDFTKDYPDAKADTAYVEFELR